MSESDLVHTAGEIIANYSEDPGMIATIETIGNAGGFVAKETGRVVLGVLVKHGFGKLCEEYKRKQQEGEIPDDFETTEHGAKLLQEALNAISNGLDKDQADAVRKVFLGLASNPPEDSMERIQQLSIIETTASLTPWEITALNVLERISNKLFSSEQSEAYARLHGPNSRMRIGKKQALDVEAGRFDAELEILTNNQKDIQRAILQAIKSLNEKEIIKHLSNEAANTSLGIFIRRREHWLTDFGCKLAIHLYSIDPSES